MSAKQETKTETVGAKYVGEGDYIVGIPARNLTAEEWKQYKKEIAANEKAMGRPLYEPIEKTVTEEKEKKSD